MSGRTQFVSVKFEHFKALKNFTLNLRHFNVLVGPNNAGKSTILAAFRILSAGMRVALARKAVPVQGPNGAVHGHRVDLAPISVAEENIFYNYDDSVPASVTFNLSNGNSLRLYFAEQGSCVLIPNAQGKSALTPTTFKSQFNCPIGFVPILGPVEHNERLYEREAARLALFNYRAARNFRNIWYHYPERFDDFRALLRQTWPGMDIEPPEVDTSHEKPLLRMYCPEERIPREIFWAGFGFQVWCQMLTHLIQSCDVSMFLVDEPDIYLHSDLQRQLLGLLRDLGPDILIATHSMEMIAEAEADDIVLISKQRQKGRRIKNPSELQLVFDSLGSSINPILTQLAKTRRVVFVEGKDFQVISRFARRLGAAEVSNRSSFAVVPVEGFNPERIRSLKTGMETTLGASIRAAAILDRDYRSDAECAQIEQSCREFCDIVVIHRCKEIENFLLVPPAIDRAAAARVADRAKRSGKLQSYEPIAGAVLQEFAAKKRNYVTAQYIEARRKFDRSSKSTDHPAVSDERMMDELAPIWEALEQTLATIPGKEAVSELNSRLQEVYKITVTPTAIIDAMRSDEVPADMVKLVDELRRFSSVSVGKG